LRPGSKLTIGPHEFILELAEVEEDDPSVIRPTRSTTSKKSVISRLVIPLIIVLIVGIIFYFTTQK